MNNNTKDADMDTNLKQMIMVYMGKTDENNKLLINSNKTLQETVQKHEMEMATFGSMIKDLYGKLDEIKNQTETNTGDIFAIKENERITSGQRNMILKEAYKRICDFLEPGTVSWAKYYKMYFQDLYRYLRQNNYLQRPNSETRKKDFDNVMEGFTDWYPDEKTLRKNADTYAEARIEAKKQGYIK